MKNSRAQPDVGEPAKLNSVESLSDVEGVLADGPSVTGAIDSIALHALDLLAQEEDAADAQRLKSRLMHWHSICAGCVAPNCSRQSRSSKPLHAPEPVISLPARA
jgi:hypothetical protein